MLAWRIDIDESGRLRVAHEHADRRLVAELHEEEGGDRRAVCGTCGAERVIASEVGELTRQRADATRRG